MPKTATLRLVTETAPTLANGKVPPRRLPNLARRAREHLTEQEVARVIEAAGRRGRYGHRDATLILICFRHGYRVGELARLRWESVDLESGILHVSRLKRGVPSTHPLHGSELRALRRLQREQRQAGGYVFVSERGTPMSTASIRKVVSMAGEAAELGFPIHVHMLRHSCGYKLANDGVDTKAIGAYLGHRRLENTSRYCELAPERFRAFWTD